MGNKTKILAASQTVALFPPDIIAQAQTAQKGTGCWASVTLSQWADESGYGKHVIPGSNNPFNIKQFGDGPYVESPTHEWINGQNVQVMAKFVKYDSLADAFTAHGKLLMDPKGPYSHCLPFHYDAIKWAQRIAHVYATNPQYGQQLTEIICQYKLLQFDNLPAETSAESATNQ